MKLEINYRKKKGKTTNRWRLNNVLLKTNNGSMMKSKRKSENTFRKMKMEKQFPKFMGYSKSISKRKVYSDTGLSQETKKILTYNLKELEKVQFHKG